MILRLIVQAKADHVPIRIESPQPSSSNDESRVIWVKLGQPVELPCAANGVPVPEYS